MSFRGLSIRPECWHILWNPKIIILLSSSNLPSFETDRRRRRLRKVKKKGKLAVCIFPFLFNWEILVMFHFLVEILRNHSVFVFFFLLLQKKSTEKPFTFLWLDPLGWWQVSALRRIKPSALVIIAAWLFFWRYNRYRYKYKRIRPTHTHMDVWMHLHRRVQRRSFLFLSAVLGLQIIPVSSYMFR